MDDLSYVATVRALLGSAQLSVPEEELDRLVQAYPAIRAQTDALYGLDLGAEVPALVFDPGAGLS